jgi:hypothetical protein
LNMLIDLIVNPKDLSPRNTSCTFHTWDKNCTWQEADEGVLVTCVAYVGRMASCLT